MDPLTYGHLEITQVTAEHYTRVFSFFLFLQYCLYSMKMIHRIIFIISKLNLFIAVNMQIATFRLLLMGLCKIQNVYTPTKNSKHLKYWSHQLDQQFAKISILKIIISEINCIKRYVIVILNIFKFTLMRQPFEKGKFYHIIIVTN